MAQRAELIDVERGMRTVEAPQVVPRSRLTLRRVVDAVRNVANPGPSNDAALLAALESLTATLAEERRQLATLQLERARLADEREEARVETARFHAELDAERSRAAQLDVAASAAKAEAERLAPELARARGEVSLLRDEREALRIELASVKATLEGERRRAEDLENELRAEVARLRRPPVVKSVMPDAEPPKRFWRRAI